MLLRFQADGFFLGTELVKSAKRKALTTQILTSEPKNESFLSCLSPIHFHFSELLYCNSHPTESRIAESPTERGRESNTHTHTHWGGSVGGLSPGVEMEGTIAAVHFVSISSNPILCSMCVCSTAEKGNGNKVILLHTAQRERERGRETNKARSKKECEKHTRGRVGKENK